MQVRNGRPRRVLHPPFERLHDNKVCSQDLRAVAQGRATQGEAFRAAGESRAAASESERAEGFDI